MFAYQLAKEQDAGRKREEEEQERLKEEQKRLKESLSERLDAEVAAVTNKCLEQASTNTFRLDYNLNSFQEDVSKLSSGKGPIKGNTVRFDVQIQGPP